MIQVYVYKQKDCFKSISIEGHAGSAIKGEDLVCAGVSAVSVGVLNALATYGFIDQDMGTIKMEEGFISIDIQCLNEEIKMILETLIISLKTIESGNESYITINYKEV